MAAPPTSEETCEMLGLTQEAYEKALNIHSIVYTEDLGGTTRNFYETFNPKDQPTPEDLYTIKQEAELVRVSISKLQKEREKIAVEMYYWEDQTQREIGEELGVTESRISQILGQAEKEMRRKLRRKGYTRDSRTQ